jgi:hypothetical protein
MGETARVPPGGSQPKGRSSVSTEQRENRDAVLRPSALPAGSDASELRQRLPELASAQPLPAY